MKIRAGDGIRHKPTGEKWLVAAVSPNGRELVCCGWPETIAKISDCELLCQATDEGHEKLLREVVESCRGQLRASWAQQELERWLSR